MNETNTQRKKTVYRLTCSIKKRKQMATKRKKKKIAITVKQIFHIKYGIFAIHMSLSNSVHIKSGRIDLMEQNI